MAAGTTASRVFDLIKPYVEELGLILWDVRFVKEGATWYLRVVIDSDNGVWIEDCENVSRRIDPVIDEADPIQQSYVLEVTSPGIGRELTRREHFEKMIGREVTVRTVRPVEGRRDFEGALVAYDGNVTVAENGADVTVPKDNIASVKLVEEL